MSFKERKGPNEQRFLLAIPVLLAPAGKLPSTKPKFGEKCSDIPFDNHISGFVAAAGLYTIQGYGSQPHAIVLGTVVSGEEWGSKGATIVYFGRKDVYGSYCLMPQSDSDLFNITLSGSPDEMILTFQFADGELSYRLLDEKSDSTSGPWGQRFLRAIFNT